MGKKFNEKYIGGFLIFLGVAALLVGVLNIKSTIRAPFIRPYTGNKVNLSLETELKNKDTDQDGLSDYDELNIYKTSPYLEDSDSDGINDRQEVTGNSDPNCPAGQSCAAAALPATESPSDSGFSLGIPGTEDLLNLLGGTGLSDEALAGLSDEELTALLQGALTGATTTTEGSSDSPTATPPASEISPEETKGYLKNISAGELRKLLLDSGFDKKTLDSLDDATLKNMFLETL